MRVQKLALEEKIVAICRCFLFSPLRGIFEERPTLPCMVSACTPIDFARLFGELDGALRQPHGFCRSGIVSGTYRTAFWP